MVSSTSNKEISKKVIEENKPITIADVGEITLMKSVLVKEVVPPKATGRTIIFESTDQIIWLDSVVNLNSLMKNSMIVGRIINVKVKYDGKYNYNTIGTTETFNGANFVVPH